MKKSFIPAAIMLLLLFHPALSFEGAKYGLLLWFQVILPTLLPFMLCSALIVSWDGISLTGRLLRPAAKLFHLSDSGIYVFLTGILCGYPMGAKTAADFSRSGKISLQEAKRLLAFVSFPSPMFLSGYIHFHLPESVPFYKAALALYLPILILSPLSCFIYPDFISSDKRETPNPNGSLEQPFSFDAILMNALEIMVKIGGVIMICSILSFFVNEFLPSVGFFKPLLLGAIEITTGIRELSHIPNVLVSSVGIIASAAFGGLSGIFQTNAVIKNAGLSIRHYLFWKLLHAFLSSVFLILLLYR